jgi:hypothetical protein
MIGVEDYVALRFNTIAGDSKINVIMRRPDGYVSDVVVDLHKPVIHGICAICSEDMQQTEFGYICKQHNVPVVMAKSVTTKVVATRKQFAKTNIGSNHVGMIRDNKVDMADVKQQVADALEDLL